MEGLKIITPKTADPLIDHLLHGRLTRLVQESKQAREQGMRGAILFEVLGWLSYRRPKERDTARRVLEDLSAQHLYKTEWSENLDPAFVLRAADWILDHEFPQFFYRQKFNPALRVQVLAILGQLFDEALTNQYEVTYLDALDVLQRHGLSETDRHALFAEFKMAIGDLEGAFFAVQEALRTNRDAPMARRAGHLLFQSAPLKSRVEIMQYCGPQQKIRNIGVSPFPGLGFLVKEYTGAAALQQRPTRIQMSRPPELPPVDVLTWQPGWSPSKPGADFWQILSHSPILEMPRERVMMPVIPRFRVAA